MPLNEDVREYIRKYAIKNAIDYGKAREEIVLGRVVSKDPNLKSQMAELRNEIKAVVSEINGLDKQALEGLAKGYEAEFAKEYEEKVSKTGKPSFEIEGAEEGKFKTRFPPNPNGYMHIGHSKAAFIEREITDIYKGKMALYFDDTNPEKDRQEYVDQFKKDLAWLGINFDEEYYASDNIPKMYQYAEQLIKAGKAYVCDCAPDEVKKGRENGTACNHKILQIVKDNLKLWKELLKGKAKENSVLRYSGDLKALNSVMRDPVLFRIKAIKDYRQGEKYRVWPTYDMNTPIMDSINGITDTVRSKEYELRDELYNTILDLLKLRKPRIHSISRLEIENNITSKRQLNELISRSMIKGYDDPRLVTIAALRRRGIMPQAIREFVLKFGMSKAESKTGIDGLLAINRRLIDKEAKRLYFIEDPVALMVDHMPEKAAKIRLRLHPNEELGYREYELSNKFLISKADSKALKKGISVRLKDAFEIRITFTAKDLISAEYVEGSNPKSRMMWLSDRYALKSRLYVVGELLKDGEFNSESMKQVDGYIESYAGSLRQGEMVQLDGLGYFRLDSKEDLSFISL